MRRFLITLHLALGGLRTADLRDVLGYDEAVQRAADAERELGWLKAAVAPLLTAQGRILDGWAEASPVYKRQLWSNLHETADGVRDALDQPGGSKC